jgi:hypothetical protein
MEMSITTTMMLVQQIASTRALRRALSPPAGAGDSNDEVMPRR